MNDPKNPGVAEENDNARRQEADQEKTYLGLGIRFDDGAGTKTAVVAELAFNSQNKQQSSNQNNNF